MLVELVPSEFEHHSCWPSERVGVGTWVLVHCEKEWQLPLVATSDALFETGLACPMWGPQKWEVLPDVLPEGVQIWDGP